MDQHREAGRTTPSQLRASPRAWRDERLLVPAVVAAGATLRLVYYFSKPPFSADESSLALNVMHRSYGTVLERLDFNQAAPPGFLLLQKLIVEAVGPSTEAFRLLPLLASLGTLLLTYPVGRRLIGERAAILALALVAVSEPLISYGATNKQYSVDVGVALGLTFAALLYEENTSRHSSVPQLCGSLIRPPSFSPASEPRPCSDQRCESSGIGLSPRPSSPAPGSSVS